MSESVPAKLFKKRAFFEHKYEDNVVSWYNPEQFRRVYEDLFSSDIIKKRRAVDQISVWEIRSYLPNAIESSVGIARAMINDILYQNGSTLCTEADIQMMYSMALVRFINLSVEAQQSYQRKKLSFIAEGLGIPGWIVDLRHNATHAHMPSLSVLRIAADSAMKYLENNYWKSECEKMQCVSKEPEDVSRIHQLIARYLTLQYLIEIDDKPLQHVTIPVTPEHSRQEMKKLKRKLLNCILKNKKEFIEIICMDNNLIPNETDLRVMITRKEFANLIEGDDDDDANSSKCRMPELPKILEILWHPIFYYLNAHGAVSDLVEHLLYTQSSRCTLGQRLITAWCVKLFGICTAGPKPENSELSKAFSKNALQLNWERMLHAAIAKPCKYTAFVLPLIMSHLNLKESFTRSIMNLVAISQGLATDDSFRLFNKSTVFSLQSLKETKKLQDEKRGICVSNDSIWAHSSETIDFKSLPIGAIIHVPENNEDEDADSYHWPEDEQQEEVEEEEVMETEHQLAFCSEDESVEDLEESNDLYLDENIFINKKFLYKPKDY